MPATPAYVVDAAYNVLAWNQAAVPFIGNLAGRRDGQQHDPLDVRPPRDRHELER